MVWIRSGSVRGSIYLVLLVSGRFCVSKTIITEAQEHFLTPSNAPRYSFFAGLGLRNMNRMIASEPSHWINHLAQALDDLAGSATAVRIYQPTLTNSQYRSLALDADRDVNASILFEEYYPKLGSDPSAAIEIIQKHPIVRRVSAVSAEESAVMMLMPPSAAFHVELDRLVLYMTKSAVRNGGHYAARVLDDYLTLSEAKALPAREITLFRGLQVDRRFEIAEGAFIAPYAELVDQGLLKERKKVPSENPPDYRQMGVAAVVRDLTWGPGINPPMTSGTPTREDFPSLLFPCLGNQEGLGIIMDFLSFLTQSELDILSTQYRCADFMEQIDPNFTTGSTTALVEASRLRPFRPSGRSLEAEHEDSLRQLLQDWANGDGIAGHALRRLTSSVIRTGRFRLEDSILDLSIALEMMYSIDSEMTYKLGTRAGYFVGCDAGERKRIFAVVKQLYDRRSDIVHGRRTTRRDLERAYSGGLEVARDTLFKLLRTKIIGDRTQFWNDLVMTGDEKWDDSERDFR